MPLTYQFGPHLLDVRERLLTRDGTPISLPPKVFDTLVALVSSPGRLLEKEELLQRVWPDSFVEEGNLSVNISTLRRVLGNAPDGRPYIETVAKRGYRFIVPVHEVANGDDPATAKPASPTESGATAASSRIGIAREDARQEIKSRSSKYFLASLNPRVALLVLALLALATGLSFWVFASRPVSLAVLPFESQEPDSFVQILCDSTTKRIIDDLSLSGNADLRVKARSAVLDFAGRRPNAVEAGKKLNVDFVLSGNVRRQNGALFAVQVEMVRVADGVQVFGKEYYDTNHLDFPSLWQTIVHESAAHLPVRFTSKELKHMAQPKSKSPEADRLVDQAGALFWKASPESLYQAISLCQRAIDLDPTCASAYGQVASAYAVLGDIGAVKPQESAEKSRHWVVKALQVDDTEFNAHLLMLVRGWNPTGKQPDDGFIERNLPGFAFERLAATGQLNKMEKLARDSPEEPLSGFWLAQALYYQRRYEEAVAQFRRLIAESEPPSWYVHSGLGFSLLHAGKPEEAAKEFELVKKLYSNAGRLELVIVSAQLGRRMEAEKMLADLLERTADGREYIPHVWLSFGYASVGNKDEAFRQLKSACQEREPSLRVARVDPQFDSFRGDARFQEVLRCMESPRPANSSIDN